MDDAVVQLARHRARHRSALALLPGAFPRVSVEVDGPAHKAGVLQGDMLTASDGQQPVRRLRDVLDGPDSVGQTATLSIVRAGQPASAEVTISPRKRAVSAGGPRKHAAIRSSECRLICGCENVRAIM
jgi:C-terminal processing protease CtpA/Prc